MIKPPIFIRDGGDLSIFETIADVTSYIEPVDVLNNVYVGYDSQGRLLTLKARSDRNYHPIEIELAETEPSHQAELRTILLAFLKAVRGAEPSFAEAPLEELILKSLSYK